MLVFGLTVVQPKFVETRNWKNGNMEFVFLLDHLIFL